jgi:hypothetical protein
MQQNKLLNYKIGIIESKLKYSVEYGNKDPPLGRQAFFISLSCFG